MAVGIAVFAESLTIVQTAADERIGREWPRRMGRDGWAESGREPASGPARYNTPPLSPVQGVILPWVAS